MTEYPSIEEIYNTLMNVSMPETFEIIEGKEQRLVKSETWGNFFDNIIKAQHWHKTDTHTTPHSESLYEHMCETGRICYNEAINLGWNNRKVVKAYISGLLHDIGKPGVTVPCSEKHLSAKGHGLNGGAMIDDFVNDSLIDTFAKYGLEKNDWSDISTVADIHMCLYFCKANDYDNSYHIACGQLFNKETKEILCVLRIGDQLSRIPFDDGHNEDTFGMNVEQIKTKVYATQQKFTEDLLSDEFQLLNRLKSLEINNGILVRMQGTSGSGKSKLARDLNAYIQTKQVVKSAIVSRDKFLVKWARHLMGKPPINLNEITPEIYQEAYKFYIDKNKFFSSSIDRDMKETITDILFDGGIVFVDTLMTAHPMSIKCIQSDACKKAFIIDIWCHRNTMITNEETLGRHGMSLDTQIRVHGNRSKINPFKNDIQWGSLVANTEHTEINFDNYSHPHISVTYGWNNIKINMLENLMNQLVKIYEWNQSIPRLMSLDTTFNMTLQELVHYLYNNGGRNAIDAFFDHYKYKVSEPSNSNDIYGIKYVDGINQLWRPKWAREARGRFYDANKDKTICLKEGLQRGVEILTKAHIDDGVNETQDMTDKKLEDFDDKQQKVLNKFMSGNVSITGTLTGKVDGSLLEINRYPNTSPQYTKMVQFLEAQRKDDPFACIAMDYCVKHNLPLYNISTQGTLLIGDQMRDYFLTSIQPHLANSSDGLMRAKKWNENHPGLVPPTDLKELGKFYTKYEWPGTAFLNDLTILELNNEESDFTNWKRLCPSFIKLMERFVKTFPSNIYNSDHPQYLKFESVNKDRKTYRGNVHTELAVGYPFSGISFLGLMIDSKYIPHFYLSQSKSVIPHPVHRRMDTTSEVFNIMRDLNDVVMDKQEMTKFMEKWFHDQQDYPIHAEGFVYLDEDDYNIDNKTNDEIIKDILNGKLEEDYYKIKLPIYYNTHKIQSSNVSTLMSLPSSVDKYFPIIGILKDFYTNLEPKLVCVIGNILEHLHEDIMKGANGSYYYTKLNSKAQLRIDDYLSLPDDNKQSTVFKMVINICKTHLAKKIDEETELAWNLSGETQRMFIQNAIMTIQGWQYIGKPDILKNEIHKALNNSDGKKVNLTNIAYNALVNAGENGLVM